MDIPTDMTIWPSDKEMTEVIELLKFLAKFLLALMPALTILKEDIDRKHVLDLFLLKFEHALSRMRVPDPSDYKLLPLTDDKVLEIVLKLEQAASLASSLKPTITKIRCYYIRRSQLKPLVLMLNSIRNDICESMPFEVPPAPPSAPPSEPKRHVSFSVDLASLSVAERNVLAQEAIESKQFDSSKH